MRSTQPHRLHEERIPPHRLHEERIPPPRLPEERIPPPRLPEERSDVRGQLNNSGCYALDPHALSGLRMTMSHPLVIMRSEAT